MKTSMTLRSMALIALLGTALAAPVFAQGGAGMGCGMGGGPCMHNGAAGGGPGMGRGMGFNQNNTRGWELMTPQERSAFQTKMREVKTYDECTQLQTEHRGAMEVRAREKGVTLQAPRQDHCERMRARGMIK